MQAKREIFQSGVENLVTTLDSNVRLELEKARRLIQYVGNTYFKHLRLFDFVLKNTKLSVKKYVNQSFTEP